MSYTKALIRLQLIAIGNSSAKDAFEKALRQIDQKHRGGVESAQAIYLDKTGRVKSNLQTLINRLGLVCDDWSAPAWRYS